MLGTVLYYHLCSSLQQKIVFGVPLADDALRKLVPRHPWPTCPHSSRKRRTWGLFSSLNCRVPPEEPQSLHVASWDKWLAAGDAVGGPDDREESRCPGKRQEVGRSPRGCCRGRHILTAESPHVQFTKQREVWGFFVVFFQKASLGNDAYVTSFLSLVIHCLSCFLHFKF